MGDASHQPMAGNLEATALAGIGQNADEETDDVELNSERRDSHGDSDHPGVYPNMSTPTSVTALDGPPEQLGLGETTIATSNTQTSQTGSVNQCDVNKLGSMPAGYVMPDPDPSTPPPRSRTSLAPSPCIEKSGATPTPIDDKGYLKLKVPSNLHLDKIGSPLHSTAIVENGPDGNNQASQEESLSKKQSELSTYCQEDIGATHTQLSCDDCHQGGSVLGQLNGGGHLANGDVGRELQTISQTGCIVKSKPDSNQSGNDSSKFRKQSFSRSKQLTSGCIETDV